MRLLISSIGILITIFTVFSFLYCKENAKGAAITLNIVLIILSALFTKISYDDDEKTFINWVINLILGIACILYAILMSNLTKIFVNYGNL